MLMLAGAAVNSHAATYYVSAASGNNTNSGLSWAAAKQMIHERNHNQGVPLHDLLAMVKSLTKIITTRR